METIYVEGIHQQDEEGRRVLFGKVSKEPNPEQEQDPSQFALSLSSLRRDRVNNIPEEKNPGTFSFRTQ